MKKYQSLKPYLLLWSTQSLSALGSAMTGYALILWLYRQRGSALETALLSICSYAPYVLVSIFAGALSDRWNKKRTMLVCDLLAAMGTVAVLVLLKTGQLEPWHLYGLNAINGLMNTVQQPASDVAATLLVPKRYYQKTSGLRSFSSSLNTILHPVFASALFGFFGMEAVIAVDLAT
ncbi:MAG: MFS transporter, partial [Acutalibacter sp.]|nr:MFS transporter [Acutalibacter sp.]